MSASNRQELLCSQLKWLKPASSPLVFDSSKRLKDATVTLDMDEIDYILSIEYKTRMMNSGRKRTYRLKSDNIAVVATTEYLHIRQLYHCLLILVMTEDGTWQIVPLLCKHESTSKTNILNKWKDQLLDFLLPKNYNSCNTLTDVDEVSYANPDVYRLHLSPNYVSLVPEVRPWLDMTEMCHRIYNSTWTRDQLISYTDTANKDRRLSLTVNGNQQSFTRHFTIHEGDPVVIQQLLSEIKMRRAVKCTLPPLPAKPYRPTSFSSESGSSGDGVHISKPSRCGDPPGFNCPPYWMINSPPDNTIFPPSLGVLPRSVPTSRPPMPLPIKAVSDIDYMKRYSVSEALRKNANVFGDDCKRMEEQYENKRKKFFKPKPRPATRSTDNSLGGSVERLKASEIDCTITALINREPVAMSPDPFDLNERERDIFCVSLELLAQNSIKDDEGGWEAFAQHVLHIEQDELETIRGFSYAYGSLKLSVILYHWHKMSQVASHLCKEPPSKQTIRNVLIKMKKFDVLHKLKWDY